MDKLIDLKKLELAKALTSLQKAVLLHLDPEVVRDTTLRRFAFTSELAWKVLKLHIEAEAGVEVMMPKDAYRAAQKRGLITLEETEMALAMVDDRNRLAHDYSEEFAQKLFERIKTSYAPLLAKIAQAAK